jgi:hypothetical protein
MEILVEGLFELFGELILGFVFELLGSLLGSLSGRIWNGLRSVARPAGTPPVRPRAHSPYADDTPTPAAAPSGPASPSLRLAFYLVVGTLLGGLSLLLFPQSFARTLDTRVAVLIGTPLACGLMMAAIGEFKRKRGRVAKTLESFGFGCAFALPMALLRFFLAT